MRTRFVILAVILTLMANALVTESALAASCDPGRTWYADANFAGTTKSTNLWGVRAKIEQYAPFVSTNPPGHSGPNQTQAWVMLNEGGSHWVQIGWRRNKNADGTYAGRLNWLQYTDSSGAHDEYFGDAASTGTLTKYAITRTFDGGEGLWSYEYRIDGVPVWTTLEVWEPGAAQWFSETSTYDSQVPGNLANHVSFELVQSSSSSAETWVDADTATVHQVQGPDSGSLDDSFIHVGHAAPDTYSTWDGGCP